METGPSKRQRKEKIKKEISRKVRSSIQQKIKEIKISKKGLTSNFLCDVMCNQPNFIGVVPQDFIKNIRIESFPISLIINIDTSNKPGSHLVGLGKTMLLTHNVYATPDLQTDHSNLCGFY